MTLHRMFEKTLGFIEMIFINLWLPIGAILKPCAFNALILLYMSQIRELLPPFSQMSYSPERHAVDFSRHEASAGRLPMLSMFCTS